MTRKAFPLRPVVILVGCVLRMTLFHAVVHSFVFPKTSSSRQPSTVTGGGEIDGMVQRTKCTLTRPTSRTTVATAAVVKEGMVQSALQSNNVCRGKLLLVVSKLAVSPTKYWTILKRIWRQTFWTEVVLMALLVNAIPVAHRVYEYRHKERTTAMQPSIDNSKEITKCFATSKSRRVAMMLRQIGILQVPIYTCDVICVILKNLDFTFVTTYNPQSIMASCWTIVWLTYNVARLKRYYLCERGMRESSKNNMTSVASGLSMTERETLDRMINVFVYAAGALAAIDVLGIEIGFALKSILGLGSFGTLALSLASKDLAAEFVGGLMIQGSNFFREGETLTLQDGTEGTVSKIGWLVRWEKENIWDYE